MNTRRLAFAVLPVVGAASLGALGSRRAPSTYGRQDKPRWAPPAAAFGPIRGALYGAVAAVGWRIYASSSGARRLHLVQLTLNAAWPGDDPLAAALLTPYLGWCGFATALNAAVHAPTDGAQ